MAIKADKKVVLYFIGTEYIRKGLDPIFEVRGKVYPEPSSDGLTAPLKLGDTIEVNEGDVDALLRKSSNYVKGQGEVVAFTTRPDIAAAIVEQSKRGVLTPLSSQPSLTQLLAIAPTDELKEQVSSILTVEDLQRMLEEKQGKAQSVSKGNNSASDEPLTSEKSEKPLAADKSAKK